MTIKFIDNELIIGSTTIPENVTFRFSDILRLGGGGSSPSWQDIILSGNGSLTLTNAKANGLNYLKLFGACEQDGTPTPTVPVDIVCNNGAIKVRHQSGLPLEYQPYEYITASGNQWLNTGVKLASTDITETVFKNTSTTGYGALYGVFAMGDSSAFYANGTYYGYDETNGKVNTGISVDTNWHTLRQDFRNGVITLDGNDTTYTPFEFENTKDNYLFARYYNNSYGYGFKGSCRKFKVIRDNEVICDMIPVKRLSDDEIGMYDFISDTFYGNLGTGSLTATNPINDLELYIDGTTETVSIGKGFNDVDGQGTFVTPSGSATTRIYKAFGQLPNGKYKVAITGNFEFIFQYKDTDALVPTDFGNIDTWTTSGVYDLDKTGYYYGIAIRYPNNGTIQPSDFNGTITLIPLSNSATAQPLLGVGDYKDVQEIKTGAITRNVGIKILDGTERFTVRQTQSDIATMSLSDCPRYAGSSEIEFIVSHFIFQQVVDGGSKTSGKPIGFYAYYSDAQPSTRNWYFNVDATLYPTADDFKQFLADQYANGTPVIIVYPLATPTTETVTGQTLHIQAGTNVVEITQASINNLPLEVSYKGTV